MQIIIILTYIQHKFVTEMNFHTAFHFNVPYLSTWTSHGYSMLDSNIEQHSSNMLNQTHTEVFS